TIYSIKFCSKYDFNDHRENASRKIAFERFSLITQSNTKSVDKKLNTPHSAQTGNNFDVSSAASGVSKKERSVCRRFSSCCIDLLFAMISSYAQFSCPLYCCSSCLTVNAALALPVSC